MFIQLDKDFRMTSDPNNLILEKRSEIKSKEDGTIKEIWANGGNYTHLNGLLNGYMRKSIMKSSAETLEELVADIKRIEKNIDKQLGGNCKCKENSIEIV